METAQGLSVTTNSVEVIESINHYHNQIIGTGPDAVVILEAVQAHPDNLLLQVYSATLYLFAQTDESTALAKQHLSNAERLLKTANLREQLTYQATVAWCNRDYECAITLFTSLTQLYPRDTLAAKFAEWLFYCTGQYYQAHRYLAMCENMAAVNKQEPHFLAMYSFALELSGHLEASRDVAEKAIALNRVSPWAHHTLAHFYLRSNQINQGIQVLEKYRDSWDLVLPLIKGHNLWHLALFHLSDRNDKETLANYPFIFGTMPELASVQIDAISLLWRLDLAGFPQDKKLKEVANVLENHPFEQYTGFNNVHFIYCLARAGNDKAVKKSLQSMEQYASRLPKNSYQKLWSNTIIPYCKAIHAFVKNDMITAYELMTPIIDQCPQLGGSDAQDELFTQTYLQCLLHLHKTKEATEVFSQYLPYYRKTALAEYWFSAEK